MSTSSQTPDPKGRPVKQCGRVLPHPTHLTLHGRQAYRCLGIAGAPTQPAEPLSPERLAEIAARAEAAAPGPWFLHDDWPGRVFSESQFNHHVARVTGSNPEANERFIAHAREDVPALVAEVERLSAKVREFGELAARRESELIALRPRVAELEGTQEAPSLALPWAHRMSDDDLHLFLNDLVSAAIDRWRSDPSVPDRQILATVEKVCAEWRTPGQGSRSDEPETAPDTEAGA